MNLHNTICAIATPPGEGAIAVIRISGEQCFEITDKIFESASKNKKLTTQKSHTLLYGYIKDNGEILDEVLVAIYKKPHSYTGEDSVEIFCHGSEYIQRRIMELLVEAGAVLARPGEFTMRAFLNGKIDLAQAEAVSDLISSKSKMAAALAMKQLKGVFSSKIKQLKDKLIDLLSLIELELDFGEEEVEFADRSELISLINEIENWTAELMNSFHLGNALKEGIPVAITGKPNVGKSTLLNLLLRENKAIVSDIPGTTRDIVEDVINIKGVRFRLIDTAGIRQTEDVVENLGIERSVNAIQKADINIVVADATLPTTENEAHLKKVFAHKTKDSKVLVLINKIDVSTDENLASIRSMLANYDTEFMEIVAKKDAYAGKIYDKIFELSGAAEFYESESIAINERHYQALARIKEAVNEVRKGLEIQLPVDLLTQELKQIMFYLGEISGEITEDDILGNIFSKFCIGK